MFEKKRDFIEHFFWPGDFNKITKKTWSHLMFESNWSFGRIFRKMPMDKHLYTFGPGANFEIHLYRPEYKEALLQLLKLNTPKYFAESEKADYNNYLDHEVESYFVIKHKSGILGAGGINYFEHERLARISWDIVHPEWQGTGIGRHLVSYRMEVLSKRTDLHKVVVRTSQLTYEFYEKMGFELEMIQEHYWAPDLHLYQMSMEPRGRS